MPTVDPRVPFRPARQFEQLHWVLLCRKGVGTTPALVQNGVDENGEPILVDSRPRDELSSRFNDIAMVGHNPRTGRTCFFQNAIAGRYDGSRVAHPADIEKSESDDRQAYLWSGVHGAQGGWATDEEVLARSTSTRWGLSTGRSSRRRSAR